MAAIGNNGYQTLSSTISWMRFPLIFMIVLLHCYCAIDAHGHHNFFQMVYPFGLLLGETGVPAFFFVSGFLFFYSHKSYRDKLKSRVKSLLIPYVFWNAFILLAYVLLAIVGHPMQIAGKNITDYGLLDYLRAFIDRGSWDQGNGVPMLCPYWYIRNLMIICVFSPIIYYIIRYLKWIPVLALFVWWMSIPYNGMIASSLLFFSIGAYFSIEQKNPIVLLQKYKIVLLCFWAIVFLFDWAHCFWNVSCFLYVHRISLLLNIFLLLLVGIYFGNKQYLGRETLDKSAFWIYTVHYPMTIAFGTIFAKYFLEAPDWLIFVYYWCTVLCVIALCVISYVILHRLCPKVLSFVTGSRS